jgi:XTP/dITP diphosphohydrolase
MRSGRLLIATTNPGKLREIRAILAGVPVELVSLDAWPDLKEPEETRSTFEENAREKALYYAEATGLPAVAEDSGLEIDALDGAPGVRSARFPGETYADKFRLIYRLLDERGGRGSPARFVCALALAENGRVTFEARGVVEGVIAPDPRGAGGFGYDPIFLVPSLGCTLAELPEDAKSAVSHRGRAFGALRAHLLGTAGRTAGRGSGGTS